MLDAELLQHYRELKVLAIEQIREKYPYWKHLTLKEAEFRINSTSLQELIRTLAVIRFKGEKALADMVIEAGKKEAPNVA